MYAFAGKTVVLRKTRMSVSRGAQVGDRVVSLGDTSCLYLDVLALAPALPRPLVVVFERPPTPTTIVVSRGACDAVFHRRTPAPRPRRAASPPRLLAVLLGPDPLALLLGHDRPAQPLARDTGPDFSQLADADVPTSTKLELSAEYGDDKEFDVEFGRGALGMRLEERVGLVALTVVTAVDATGTANDAGVRVGCVILGLNGERYLSHAHTTATLKHGRRPVTARLRYAD